MDSISTAVPSSLLCPHWALSPLSWGCLWHLHFDCWALGRRGLISAPHLIGPKGNQQKNKKLRWHYHPILFFGDFAAVNPFPHPGPLALSQSLWFLSWGTMMKSRWLPLATLLRVVSQVMNWLIWGEQIKSKNVSLQVGSNLKVLNRKCVCVYTYIHYSRGCLWHLIRLLCQCICLKES